MRSLCLNADMFRPFPLFIGLRYARASRGARFVSVVSAVALCGLALGVMALVVVLSVMNGFDRELRTRILALRIVPMRGQRRVPNGGVVTVRDETEARIPPFDAVPFEVAAWWAGAPDAP